jgi:SAM-dependent methyltransferase
MNPTCMYSSREALKGRIGLGVRSAVARFYPGYQSESDVFLDCVGRYVNEDAVVLDAGCGNGAFKYELRHRAKFLAGCDVSDGLDRNSNVTAIAFSDLNELAFASESFDLIFSRYVFEHLDKPERVFAEFARVLKPGGKLVVLTPNKRHYVALLSRLTPHAFHEQIGKLRGNSAHDLFPTRYVANSRVELRRYARETGLGLLELIALEARPNYLMWSLPSFVAGVAYERVVNRFEFLSGFRSSIIAVFEREPGSRG